jgi:quercetin dioxygenase-like cupin family protein
MDNNEIEKSKAHIIVEIIDGKAEILIDGISHLLVTGQSIIISAPTSNIVRANQRFKMISTIIKSGYE